MKKIRITLIRSMIGRPSPQCKSVKALGLRKIHASVEHVATPQIMGMIRKVNHLIKVEEI
jgi:large subunit ribosomal protein L30